MDTLQGTLKSLQENHPSQKPFGLTSFFDVAQQIRKQNQAVFSLTALHGLTDIATILSQQKQSNIAGILGSSFPAMLAAQQVQQNYSLFGLTHSLTEIAKTNNLLADRLSAFGINQVLLSNNWTEIAKSVNQSHLYQFNVIDFAIQGASRSYLNDIVAKDKPEDIIDDINIAEEVTETLASITGNVVNNADQVTLEDLEDMKISIIKELSSLLTKTRTERARLLIFEIIHLVGFLLHLYTFHEDAARNRDSVRMQYEARDEIKKMTDSLSINIYAEFNKLYKTRIANKTTNLRYLPRRKSKIIGVITAGQEVTVIEIQGKYLLVSYIDDETKKPKSGFVMKKYFAL